MRNTENCHPNFIETQEYICKHLKKYGFYMIPILTKMYPHKQRLFKL